MMLSTIGEEGGGTNNPNPIDPNLNQHHHNQLILNSEQQELYTLLQNSDILNDLAPSDKNIKADSLFERIIERLGTLGISCTGEQQMIIGEWKNQVESVGLVREIERAFESGEAASFYKHWNQWSMYNNVNVNNGEKDEIDEKGIKDEFDFHLYQCIHPLLSVQAGEPLPNLNANMELFKDYLSRRGPILSRGLRNEPSYLVYYALPYVGPDPRLHPSFQPLFQGDSWAASIREKFNSWSTAHNTNQQDNDSSSSSSAADQKKKAVGSLLLQEIYKCFWKSTVNQHANQQSLNSLNASNNNNNHLIRTLQTQLRDADERAHSLAQRLSLLKSNYGRLLSITADLVEHLIQALSKSTSSSNDLSLLQDKSTTTILWDLCERLLSFKRHGEEDESILMLPMAQAQLPHREEFVPLNDYQPPQTPVNTYKPRSNNNNNAIDKVNYGNSVQKSVPTSESDLDLEKIFKVIQGHPVFKKGKLIAVSGDETLRTARLLQALRWRCLGSGPLKPGTINPTLVNALISKDLFELYQNDGSSSVHWLNTEDAISALQNILEQSKTENGTDVNSSSPSTSSLTQLLLLEVFLLFNALCSFSQGRCYLTYNDGMTPHTLTNWHWLIDQCLFFWSAPITATSNATAASSISNGPLLLSFRKVAWAILSKLSVRRRVQTYLLGWRKGLFTGQLFLQVLRDPEPVLGTWEEDPWIAERTMVMCMNFSVRSEARKQWKEQGTSILKLLTDLIEHRHALISTYACSALFYLLSDEQFGDASKQLGISDMLKYWIDECKNSMSSSGSSDQQPRLKQLELLLETVVQATNNSSNRTIASNDDAISEDGDDPDCNTAQLGPINEGLLMADPRVIPELIEEMMFERMVDYHLDEGITAYSQSTNASEELVIVKKGEEFFVANHLLLEGDTNVHNNSTNAHRTAVKKSLPWNKAQNSESYQASNVVAPDTSYSRPRTPFDAATRNSQQQMNRNNSISNNGPLPTSYDNVFAAKPRLTRTPI